MGAHHEPRGKYVDPTTTRYVDAEVTAVARIVDGDTVLLTRQFAEITTDWTLTLTVDRYPVRCRLVVVNTPELRTELGPQAKADTTEWLQKRTGALRARTYGSDDFGRQLTDLYDVETGESLSSFLLSRGYPSYTPK